MKPSNSTPSTSVQKRATAASTPTSIDTRSGT